MGWTERQCSTAKKMPKRLVWPQDRRVHLPRRYRPPASGGKRVRGRRGGKPCWGWAPFSWGDIQASMLCSAQASAKLGVELAACREVLGALCCPSGGSV